MNLHLRKNVFHCNYCGERGGMLALYAKARAISNAEAYERICSALLIGNCGAYRSGVSGYPRAFWPNGNADETETMESIENAGLADAGEIHRTFSQMLSLLTLSERHRRNLLNRGLTDRQIDQHGYKSTPSYDLCHSLASRLIRQGYTVKGVPGFYLGKDGRWTVKFYTNTAGVLIPVRGIDGLIRGAQIRLDAPIKGEEEGEDKTGAKYIWLSSSNKHMGVTSGSPVHFVGDPFARTVYVTEGSLKADVAHCLMDRTFAAVPGANNLGQLSQVLSALAYHGTKLIVEALDMDKFQNKKVEAGADKIRVMALRYGMESRQLIWDRRCKGIDDWQLSLKTKREQSMAA